ncbi:SAG-related sequence [Besnoitia besnoiti]|uniref:SAG-related sequence n=1 Tax=Besnoitia besnoiti TaxID=94643 RepID=A0A2A9MNC8_BESBE|nr:SAG-related sequence [Besnoitia besnoiti]PFH37383.1 SAG-related sequence [Besnoitia besnoiti]
MPRLNARSAGFAAVVLAVCSLTGIGVSSRDITEPQVENNVCEEDTIDITLPIHRNNVTFQCFEDFPIIDPAKPEDVYKDVSHSESGTTDKLASLLPRATLTGDGDHSYTVMAPVRLDKDVTLVYVCRRAGEAGEVTLHSPLVTNSGKCVVTITVKGTGEKPVTCSPGEDTEIMISSPESTVKMKCPPKLAFEPRDSSSVFDNKDGKCNTAEALSALIPGAARSDADNEFALTVSRLPSGSEARALCYRCASSATPASGVTTQECTFRITVEPTDAVESGGQSVQDAAAAFLSMSVALWLQSQM